MGYNGTDDKMIFHISVNPDKKPESMLMQVNGLGRTHGKFGKEMYGLIPCLRIYLLPNEWLDEKCGHDGSDVTYSVDIFQGDPFIEDHILAYWGETEYEWEGDSTPIPLSDDERNQTAEYLKAAVMEFYGSTVDELLEDATDYAYSKLGKPDDPKVMCPKCTFRYTPMPTSYLEGELEISLFRCPICGVRNLISVTDKQLRNNIEKWRMMWREASETVENGRGSAEKEMLRDEANKMKQRNLERMHELRNEFIKQGRFDSDAEKKEEQ